MQTFMVPKPFNEAQRIEALKSYGDAEAGANEFLDRLTKLACSLFGVPISLVSLVHAEQQVFKSRQGLDAEATDREHAFCSHTILGRSNLVVPDATLDARFAGNPLVMGEPGIRFYAGCPLITSVGFRLGAFCLIDTVARDDFDGAKCDMLGDLATLAMFGLDVERRRVSLTEADGENAAAADAQFAAIASVAHDIRAPLGVIVSYASVMESETFGPMGNERYRSYSSDIVRSGLFLVNLSRKVLDIARLRTGEIEISEDTLRFPDILDEAAGLVADSASRRSIRIVTRSQTSQFRLCADRTYVLQMLVNLLSNAIRFSSRKSDILLEAHCHDQGLLDLTVLDRGIGMSPDEVAHALTPFGQVGERRAEDDDGIGLGLPLVEQLIELHGGKLLIESRKGVGTAATLRFPVYRLMADAA